MQELSAFATIWYIEERTKPEGMSAHKVAEIVNQEFNTAIHPRSMNHQIHMQQ